MVPTDATHPRGPTRRDPRLLWIIALVLLVARVGLGFHEAAHPVRPPSQMSWVPALAAPGSARATGRPIFYDFSAEWCGPCQVMEEEVFADARRARALSQLVVPVHVIDRRREDGRNLPVVDSLQKAYGVTAFPTLVLADASGKQLAKIEGYPGADDLLKWAASTSAQQQMRRGPGAAGGLTFP